MCVSSRGGEYASPRHKLAGLIVKKVCRESNLYPASDFGFVFAAIAFKKLCLARYFSGTCRKNVLAAGRPRPSVNACVHLFFSTEIPSFIFLRFWNWVAG